MKVAVASADGTTISQHFGRSRCFLVFDIEGSKVSDGIIRSNTSTAHAKGECHGDHDHDHDHHDQPHSHADVVAALQDCSAVICWGMGWRAAEELGRNGIKPVVAQCDITPREAVERYRSGSLQTQTDFCRCHE